MYLFFDTETTGLPKSWKAPVTDLNNWPRMIQLAFLPFDEKIVGAEFLRHEMQNVIQGKRKICTMEKTTNFCKIMEPHGYKWPKLSELHYKLFGQKFEDVHDAASDIAATVQCFWELKRRKLI